MCVFTAAALGTTAAGAFMANTSLAISVASTAAQMAQQRANAKAQEAAQRRNQRISSQYNRQVYDRGVSQYETESQYRADLMSRQNERYTENADRAVADATRNYDLIQDRIQQENVVAAMEINKIAKDSRAAQSQVVVGAADREVEGLSVDYLLDAIAANELEGAQNVRMERDWRHTSLMGSMDEIESQTQARIDSANPQPIPLPALPAPMSPTMAGAPIAQPSMFTAMTNAATGAVNSFSNFYQPQNIAPTAAPQNVGYSTYIPQASGTGWASRMASGGGIGGWRNRMNAWGG